MSGHGFETGVPQAATADVEVTLDITPGVRHVLQAYYPILDEAAVAPGSSCRRISPAQNASPSSEMQSALHAALTAHGLGRSDGPGAPEDRAMP
jgi:hypothetical protein